MPFGSLHGMQLILRLIALLNLIGNNRQIGLIIIGGTESPQSDGKPVSGCFSRLLQKDVVEQIAPLRRTGIRFLPVNDALNNCLHLGLSV